MKKWWLIALLPAVLAAAEFDLSGIGKSASWGFHNGGEYPGAAGKIAVADGKAGAEYDFSKGGRYVAMQLRGKLPPGTERFSIKAVPSADVKLSLRVTDANGRIFQSAPAVFKGGGKAELSAPVEKWQTSWGGKKEEKEFTLPVTAFQLVVHRDENTPLSGKVIVDRVNCSAPVAELPKAEPFEFPAGAYRVSGSFEGRPDGLLLTLKTVPEAGAQSGELSVTFPQLTRDRAWRFRTDPAKAQEFQLLIGRDLCGNPDNRYTLRISLAGQGFAGSAEVPLTGAGYAALGMDRFFTSSEIPESRIGTQVHFAYGQGNNSVFSGYADYRMLTDRIAEAGFKWIRDTVLLEKDDKGGYRVRPHDLEWMRYARSKGLKVIPIFRLYADAPVEEYLKRVDAMVRETRDLVDIYELGNEPFGQGGWRQKFGGPWNGREKDNSTSPWVREHLKYTNAIAERFKQVYPAATIIGLGANTPTNYRYLDLGVTDKLDGVSEHPYSYCLPPEKVPYGWSYEKRDGVRVGDKACSYRGLIEDYHRKFRETGKPRSLWLTECGYTTYWWDGVNEKGQYGGYTEDAQASYLARRFLESLSLDIAMVAQYCFLDKQYSKQNSAEANFGLLRGDYSEKPSYRMFRNLNSRLAGFSHAPDIAPAITAEKLHRGNQRSILVRNWDDNQVEGDNGCAIVPFRNKAGDVILAVWSKQPYSREFNNRTLSFRMPGGAKYRSAVAQDIVTGVNYDIPMKAENGDLVVENMSLQQNPLLVRLVK
ncbi:MAG: hypothetical protein HPZ91_20250 [Lentisphaeria bacterium]|nr:hypothetical protein [Lentisphaeria bacterium]